MSDQKELKLAATHIGAEPPPGTDPIGGGFTPSNNNFPNSGHFGFQPAVGNVLSNLSNTVKALTEEYSALSDKLPEALELELTATRLEQPNPSLEPAAIIAHELSAVSKLLINKTEELHSKITIANEFYGADPINIPLKDFYKTALTIEKPVRPNGIAIQAWQTSYRAAHDARLLSQTIQLLNEKTAIAQNQLRVVQEENQARLAEQQAAAAQAQAAAEADAQRLASEQAQAAAEAEAQRLAAEQARAVAEAEAQQLAADQARAAAEAEFQRQDELRRLAQEQAHKRARTFVNSGSSAGVGPAFTATAGSIVANPNTSLALKAALRSAVSAVSGALLTTATPVIAGFAALLAPSRLGNSDLYTVSVPLSELAPDLNADLQGIAADQQHVTLRVTLGSQTTGNLTRIVVASTDGASVPSTIRVQLAQFDSQRNVYVSTIPGSQSATLTWTPVVETLPQSTESPATETDVPVYAGASVTPVEGRIDPSPQLDQYSFGGFITVFPAESGIPPLYIVFSSPYDGATTKGEYSGRDYNPDEAGGPVIALDWSTAVITQEGVEAVKLHIARLNQSDANQVMISRLDQILRGHLDTTDTDRRYYTHEIRELERFRAMGLRDDFTPDDNSPSWNNAHTATLEDYKLSGELFLLYSPEAIEAAEQQMDRIYNEILKGN